MLIALVRRRQGRGIAAQMWLFAGAIAAAGAAVIILHATVGLHSYFYWTITFARQRRYPGLRILFSMYRQPSLLWTLPAAAAAVFLLRRNDPGTPSLTQPHRDMRGLRYRAAAIFFLAAPFLWTILALAFTRDPDDRAGQLLELWPHILILGAVLALSNLRPRIWQACPAFDTFLPLILLAAIQGAFLSQQLWGSTFSVWPFLILLIAALLLQVPTIARPLAAIVTATLLLCGGLYAISEERLSYLHMDESAAGLPIHATLPELRGMATPGPWLPRFEELIRVTNAEIPVADGIIIIPSEVPFYFATGRAPQFPVLLFDSTTDPDTPLQTLEESRAHNIRWLILSHDTQLIGDPPPLHHLPDYIRILQQDFTPYRAIPGYDIYRRR